MGLLDGLFDDGAGGLLVKVGVFLLIQALVYLILSSSSTVFSEEKAMARRLGSFRRARSLSIRRILSGISDVPPEHSPTSAAPTMPTIPEAHDEHEAGQD